MVLLSDASVNSCYVELEALCEVISKGKKTKVYKLTVFNMLNTYKIWTPSLRACPDNLPVQFLGHDAICVPVMNFLNVFFFNLNICMSLIHTEMIISCIHYFFHYVLLCLHSLHQAQNFSSVMKEKIWFC